MLRLNQIKIDADKPFEEHEGILRKKICDLLSIRPEDLGEISVLKRSLDARKKPDLFFSYSIAFSVRNKESVLNKALKKKSTLKYIIVHYEKKQGEYQTKKSYLKR